MSLNLTPNEVVGYRIKPDWYSFNVVEVKRHGAGSKNTGKEYETPLAYCKSLEFATSWILAHVVRVRAELNQKEQLAVDGSVADAKAILAAFNFAEAHVLQAVSELKTRLGLLNLSQQKLVQALGGVDAE